MTAPLEREEEEGEELAVELVGMVTLGRDKAIMGCGLVAVWRLEGERMVSFGRLEGESMVLVELAVGD